MVGGTTLNAVGGDPAGTALSLGNSGNDGSVRTLTFELDTTGYSDLMFSLAVAGSNATYDTLVISYSLDGIDFTDAFISLDPSETGTFEQRSADLSGFAILNNQPTLFIRTTLTGDNLVPAQHLLFDNIAFEATAIPEPSVAILMLIGGMLMAFLSRRHPQASCAPKCRLRRCDIEYRLV